MSILKRMCYWIKSIYKGEFLKLVCVDSLGGGWIITVMIFFKKLILFLRWIFIAAGGLSLVAVRVVTIWCSAQGSHCGGFTLLWSLGSRCMGFSSCGVWAFSCPTAHGIFLEQGSNPFPCIGRQIPNHWTPREVCKWLSWRVTIFLYVYNFWASS